MTAFLLSLSCIILTYLSNVRAAMCDHTHARTQRKQIHVCVPRPSHWARCELNTAPIKSDQTNSHAHTECDCHEELNSLFFLSFSNIIELIRNRQIGFEDGVYE